MRLAALLLVLTLITSCFVGGTFAKYVSQANAHDDARVAYWGFDNAAKIEIEDLFMTAYTNDNGAKSSNYADGNEDADIIAPGTTNNKDFTFQYTNYQTDKITAPEVAYEFTVSVGTSAVTTDIAENDNINWYLDGALAKDPTNAEEEGTFAALLAAIKNLSGDPSGTKVYGPNEFPAAFTNAKSTHNVKWEWVFDGPKTDEDKDGYEDQDEYDTGMGNSQTLGTAKLEIIITATQLDTYTAG